MLKSPLIHPDISRALARGGHGSKVLISDGNYPHATARGPNAHLVFLNLSPGLLSVTQILEVLVQAIPIEAAQVMEPMRDGPYAMQGDPPIFETFRQQLAQTDCHGQLTPVQRFAFYKEASAPDVCLTIATGEQRIYANLLLTLGVVRAASEV